MNYKERCDAERMAVFGVLVANKTESFALKAYDALIGEVVPPVTPFDVIKANRAAGHLRQRIEASRCGQYARVYTALSALCDLDVAFCTIEDLESIHGIGRKTSRFIFSRIRPDAKVAILDTHVLKFLAYVYPNENIPKATPSSQTEYLALEQKFFKCAEVLNMTVDELDQAIWQHYAYNKRK